MRTLSTALAGLALAATAPFAVHFATAAHAQGDDTHDTVSHTAPYRLGLDADGALIGRNAAQYVGATPVNPLPASMSKPCELEDSVNCSWDAGVSGNGQGHSFVVREFPGKAHMVCVMYVDAADSWLDYCEATA